MRPTLRSTVITPRQQRAINRDRLKAAAAALDKTKQSQKKEIRMKKESQKLISTTQTARLPRAITRVLKKTPTKKRIIRHRSRGVSPPLLRAKIKVEEEEVPVRIKIEDPSSIDFYGNPMDQSIDAVPEESLMMIASHQKVTPMAQIELEPEPEPFFMVKNVEVIVDGNLKIINQNVSTRNEKAQSTYRRLQNEIFDVLLEKKEVIKRNNVLEGQLREIQECAGQRIVQLQQEVTRLRDELVFERNSSVDLMMLLGARV